jgi:hypothetical protein
MAIIANPEYLQPNTGNSFLSVSYMPSQHKYRNGKPEPVLGHRQFELLESHVQSGK